MRCDKKRTEQRRDDEIRQETKQIDKMNEFKLDQKEDEKR